ncbi:hypothetical protein VPH184E373B_0208 [Vibrio phage 184E37-3b]
MRKLYSYYVKVIRNNYNRRFDCGRSFYTEYCIPTR